MIRVGVIGSGPIVEKHLDVLEALRGATVSAISSRRQAPRAALAGRYRVPRQVDDYRDILQPGVVDAVLVLVAPGAIREVAAAALDAGVPTFLEKPPGLGLREASELADLAERRGTANMVGLNRRFYSTIASARSLIDASGAAYGIRVEAPEDLARARAAGRSEALLAHWMLANGLHAIDLLRFLGGEPRSRHVLRRGHGSPDATSIVAIFEGAAGALVEYVSHWGSPGRWAITMYGRDVTAVLSPMEEGQVIRRGGTVDTLPAADEDLRFKPGFFRQMQAFIDMVAAGRPAMSPAADLADAVKSVELATWLAGPGRE